MKNKIGIVAMPNISTGGGFPKVVRDLIAGLNELGKEVYFLSPFKLDLDKIADFYGPIKIDKETNLSGWRLKAARENILGRKVIKKEFHSGLFFSIPSPDTYQKVSRNESKFPEYIKENIV